MRERFAHGKESRALETKRAKIHASSMPARCERAARDAHRPHSKGGQQRSPSPGTNVLRDVLAAWTIARSVTPSRFESGAFNDARGRPLTRAACAFLAAASQRSARPRRLFQY